MDGSFARHGHGKGPDGSGGAICCPKAEGAALTVVGFDEASQEVERDISEKVENGGWLLRPGSGRIASWEVDAFSDDVDWGGCGGGEAGGLIAGGL